MAEKEDFRYIVRVANTDLEGSKPIQLALTKIKGIGIMFANFVCQTAKLDVGKRAGTLSDEEVSRLTEIVKNPFKHNIPSWLLNRQRDPETGEDKHLILADLQFEKENDIKMMKKMKSYKGLRHQWGLTVRGQRTKSNFRKNKGKGSKTIGVMRKKGKK